MTTDEFADLKSSTDEPTRVAPGLAYLRDRIVNVGFIGSFDGHDGPWLLVDTGLPGSMSRILNAAELLYGPDATPDAIILTHGHFDHVGSVRELVRHWRVPVYAHELELPYLTGRSSYPPPDPAVGGGVMAMMSRFFPRKPINLGASVLPLPADGALPVIGGWRWIHTPGHAPGHMSYVFDMAESGKQLLAFDAVPMMENVEKDAPIAVGSIPEQKPLIRESHDRVVALARSEGARLLPGHCPKTWPALGGDPVELR